MPSRPTRALRAAALTLTLLAPALVAAEPPPGLAQPSLSLSAEGLDDRLRGGGTSREAALMLRGSLPLLERTRVEDGGVAGWSLSVQGEARAVALDLAEVDGAARFLRLGAGLTGSWAPSPRDAYVLQLGAFVAEQVALLGSAQLHPRAVALGVHRAGGGLRLLYGAGYTYDFGRGLPIPLLGAIWRVAPQWQLDVLLPVVVRATWSASDALALDFGTGVAGEQFRDRVVAPAGSPEPGPLEQLHILRLRLGGGCRVATWRGARVTLDAGVEGSRLDTGLSRRTAVGGYLVAALLVGGRGAAGPFGER